MAVEFRLLGDVEAWVDGGPVDLGHLRQRSVLVALLVEANGSVSTDRLVDRVWGNRHPVRVRETLYSYLSRLRRILCAVADVRVERRAGGYVVAVEREAVDVHRFRALVARARVSDGDEALALLEQALGLWRGEPFAGLDSPWLREVRDLLELERSAVELDRIDLALHRGRHAEVVTDLRRLSVSRPLDERVAGQLMLAMCRSGRVAESLAHYQRIQRRLRTEVGIEPSPALRELHHRILVADPTLTQTSLVP